MRLPFTERRMLRWVVPTLVFVVLGVGAITVAQEHLRKRIQAKAERAKKLVEQLVERGDVPLEQIAKLKRVPELGKQGKVQELERLLDEVLRELESRPKNDSADVPQYTAFRNPRRVTIRGYDDHAMEPFLSRDGRILMFNNLNNPSVNTNLHYAERIDDVTFSYQGEIGGVNTDVLEGVPTMDREGNFYFVSPRSYGKTFSTLYQGRWKSGSVSNVRLVPGISRRQPGFVNFDVDVSPDGNKLYFVDGKFGSSPPPEAADLVFARRGESGEFRRADDSQRILARVNTDALEYAACISTDGLELFFTRAGRKSGSLMSPTIWRAARKSANEPFGEPQRVSAIQGFVEATTFSPDEKALYYHRKDGGRFVIYRVER